MSTNPQHTRQEGSGHRTASISSSLGSLPLKHIVHLCPHVLPHLLPLPLPIGISDSHLLPWVYFLAQPGRRLHPTCRKATCQVPSHNTPVCPVAKQPCAEPLRGAEDHPLLESPPTLWSWLFSKTLLRPLSTAGLTYLLAFPNSALLDWQHSLSESKQRSDHRQDHIREDQREERNAGCSVTYPTQDLLCFQCFPHFAISLAFHRNLSSSH